MIIHDFEKFPELSNSQINEFGLLSPHEQIIADFFAFVVKVTDGDTVRLSTTFRDFDFPLRFLDIDAPELNEGGEASKQWLVNRIEGAEVQIQIDPDNRIDKYGRLLGRVIHGGVDVGQEELFLGLAKPFTARDEGKFPIIEKEFDLHKWV